MRKSHFNDEILVLLGPIISRFFACSNEEKNKPKQEKGACSSPISMVQTPELAPGKSKYGKKLICYKLQNFLV
jgi:hypothetical protein